MLKNFPKILFRVHAVLSETLNLNWLEAITTAKIINLLKPEKAILDCPSTNIKAYSDYVKKHLKVDAETPQVRAETIDLPAGMYSEDFPRTLRGGMPQPIRVRFRDGINVSEAELQDSIWDWVDTSRKKNVCIKTLDPTGVEIERWDLRGCFPTQITYDLIPGNDEHLYLEMTLNWDSLTKEILE